mgnify:CR=1 FL=1
MKTLMIAATMSCLFCACSQKENLTSNPFLTEFQTPYATPDFDRIQFEHYEPAFLKGIEQQNEEIQSIVQNTEAPTFENTVVALDNSGEILSRVSGVFFALTEADTNDSLIALQGRIAPMLSEHQDNIYLNADLYHRHPAPTGGRRHAEPQHRTALSARQILQTVRPFGCVARRRQAATPARNQQTALHTDHRLRQPCPG